MIQKIKKWKKMESDASSFQELKQRVLHLNYTCSPKLEKMRLACEILELIYQKDYGYLFENARFKEVFISKMSEFRTDCTPSFRPRFNHYIDRIYKKYSIQA